MLIMFNNEYFYQGFCLPLPSSLLVAKSWSFMQVLSSVKGLRDM
jgi:hypothetical protein